MRKPKHPKTPVVEVSDESATNKTHKFYSEVGVIAAIDALADDNKRRGRAHQSRAQLITAQALKVIRANIPRLRALGVNIPAAALLK